jgi:hypothetical protein
MRSWVAVACWFGMCLETGIGKGALRRTSGLMKKVLKYNAYNRAIPNKRLYLPCNIPSMRSRSS